MLSQTHLSDAIRRNGRRKPDGASRLFRRSAAGSRRRRERARSRLDHRVPREGTARRAREPGRRSGGPGADARRRSLRRHPRRPPPQLGRRVPPPRQSAREESGSSGAPVHRHRKRGARGRGDEGGLRRLRSEAPASLPSARSRDSIGARRIGPPADRAGGRDALPNSLRGRAGRALPRHAVGSGSRRQSRPPPAPRLSLARKPHGRQPARGLRRPEGAARVPRASRARGRGPRHGAAVEALRRPDHRGPEGRPPRARPVRAAPPLRGRRRGHHRAQTCPPGAAGVQPVPAGDHLRRRRGHRRLRPGPASDHLEPVHGAV